jgi:1-acyl-sn-glycerol-3-phosphate acyltransferase
VEQALSVSGLRILCGISMEVRGKENLPKGARPHRDEAPVDLRHDSRPSLFMENPAYILKKELLKSARLRRLRFARGHPHRSRWRHEDDEADARRRQEGRSVTGQQIVIFPEGTRQLPDTPADIKPGIVLHLQRASACPCVPVALNTGLCLGRQGLPAQARQDHLRSPAAHRAGPEARRVHAEAERRARSGDRASGGRRARGAEVAPFRSES